MTIIWGLMYSGIYFAFLPFISIKESVFFMTMTYFKSFIISCVTYGFPSLLLAMANHVLQMK